MACYGNTAWYPLLQSSHLAHGQGPALQYPYCAASTRPAQPCTQCAQAAPSTASLVNRITVLETQLAQIQSDKIAADNATLHLLRLQGQQFLAPNLTGSLAEVGALERKLLQATVENYRLKDELRKFMDERERERESPFTRMTPVTDSSPSVMHGCNMEPSRQAVDPGFDGNAFKPGDLLDLANDEDKEDYPSVEMHQLQPSSSHGGHKEESHHVARIEATSGTPSSAGNPTIPKTSISPTSSYVYRFNEGKALFSDVQVPSILPNTKPQDTLSSPQPMPDSSTICGPWRADSGTLGGEPAKGIASQVKLSKVQSVDCEYPPKPNEVNHVFTKGSTSEDVATVEPQWQIRDAFDSDNQRECATHKNRDDADMDSLLLPDLFKYGLRFNPGLSMRNIFRTVTIGNLPNKLTIAELMDVVRGGAIVDMKLLDTITITRTRTAMVTFQREYSALAFEDYARCHSIMFHNQRASVSIIATPTYPMPLNISIAIFDLHHTRCLKIHNFPRQIKPSELRRDLRISPVNTSDAIESLKMSKAGILEARFAGVWYAGRAYSLLTSCRKYRPCRVFFSPDPCARPLDICSNEPDGTDAASMSDAKKNLQSTTEDALDDSSGDSTQVEAGSSHGSQSGDASTKSIKKKNKSGWKGE